MTYIDMFALDEDKVTKNKAMHIDQTLRQACTIVR